MVVTAVVAASVKLVAIFISSVVVDKIVLREKLLSRPLVNVVSLTLAVWSVLDSLTYDMMLLPWDIVSYDTIVVRFAVVIVGASVIWLVGSMLEIVFCVKLILVSAVVWIDADELLALDEIVISSVTTVVSSVVVPLDDDEVLAVDEMVDSSVTVVFGSVVVSVDVDGISLLDEIIISFVLVVVFSVVVSLEVDGVLAVDEMVGSSVTVVLGSVVV
jgi:hypothetical protein